MKAVLVAAAMAAFAACADDAVVVTLSEKERPDVKTLVRRRASISNSSNVYGLTLANVRAHGRNGRRFHMGVANGLQSGFSALEDSFRLSVNGIDATLLQPGREMFREWSGDGGEKGAALSLNFDGAWVDVRFYMRPGSPVLWCEVAKSSSRTQHTPVTNVVVKVTAIPSFLDCGSGRKTRFSGYSRQVRTASRLLKAPPGRVEAAVPGDRYFVLQDGDYDGSAEGRGMGPSATWPLDDTPARVSLGDRWTTSVEYRPDLSRPFRLALLEFRSRRVSNDDFMKTVEELSK